MVRLELLNVGLVEETGGILLVMHDVSDERLLVIETGLLEGQAIALEAQGVRADRPLTQDLLHEAILRLGARVKAVEIEDFEEEAFIATVVLHRVDGSTGDIRVDARPSDAIALALRAEAPIFVSDRVMAEHGIAEEREGRFAALFGRGEAETDEDEGDGVVH